MPFPSQAGLTAGSGAAVHAIVLPEPGFVGVFDGCANCCYLRAVMGVEAGKAGKKGITALRQHRTLAEVARTCGKPVVALRSIQKGMGLHIPADGQYSDAYMRFLEKVVALQALHVNRATVEALFEKECQIMRLLHVDSLTQSPTWYLDACGQQDARSPQPTRLFLCGYDLGFRLDGAATQDTFDFESREKQLFGSREMGKDVRRLIKGYVGLLDEVRSTVAAETPVLKNALVWATKWAR